MEIPSSNLNPRLIDCLLQEQNQYREEVRMFDSHFFKVLLTYVTGLIAAFGWLGSQVLERAGKLTEGSSSIDLGTAVARTFEQLANGPFFYLFAAIPIITAIMFLMVARDWTSLNEKFNALKGVSGKLAKIVEPVIPEGDIATFRLDRGFHIPGRTIRATVEGTLFVFWFLMAFGLSLFIFSEVCPYATSTAKLVWLWFGGGVGLILGVASIVIPLILFRKRSYTAKKILSEIG